MLFLINPSAGKSEIKNKALDIIDLFTKNGWKVTVHTTQRPLEIPSIVMRSAGQYHMIVCCGGDGTLNETVTGLMHCENRPLLGYIPAGTVNDFAYSLHLSKNMITAAHTIVNGVPFACDIGAFEDRFFTYIAAFGAFTDVSYQTPQQSKNILGRAAYFLEGIKRLPSIRAYQMTVTHDRGIIEGEFLFGMITNSISVGGFKMTDRIDVSMNDGLLEVLLVRNPMVAAEGQQIMNDFLPQEYDSEFFVRFRTKKLHVFSPETVQWTLDGEYGGTLSEVRIENKPRAIQILVERESLDVIGI